MSKALKLELRKLWQAANWYESRGETDKAESLRAIYWSKFRANRAAYGQVA